MSGLFYLLVDQMLGSDALQSPPGRSLTWRDEGPKVWCTRLSGVQGRERGSTLKETWVQRGVHACDTIMSIAKGLN